MKFIRKLVWTDVETIKATVFSFLDTYPECKTAELYTQFPSEKKNTLRLYLREYRMKYDQDLYHIAGDLKVFWEMLLNKVEYKGKISKREREAYERIKRFLIVKGIIDEVKVTFEIDMEKEEMKGVDV